MTRDYSARVSEINLVIDKNMNFLQANRGFLRFLNMFLSVFPLYIYDERRWRYIFYI